MQDIHCLASLHSCCLTAPVTVNDIPELLRRLRSENIAAQVEAADRLAPAVPTMTPAARDASIDAGAAVSLAKLMKMKSSSAAVVQAAVRALTNMTACRVGLPATLKWEQRSALLIGMLSRSNVLVKWSP